MIYSNPDKNRNKKQQTANKGLTEVQIQYG